MMDESSLPTFQVVHSSEAVDNDGEPLPLDLVEPINKEDPPTTETQRDEGRIARDESRDENPRPLPQSERCPEVPRGRPKKPGSDTKSRARVLPKKEKGKDAKLATVSREKFLPARDDANAFQDGTDSDDDDDHDGQDFIGDAEDEDQDEFAGDSNPYYLDEDEDEPPVRKTKFQKDPKKEKEWSDFKKFMKSKQPTSSVQKDFEDFERHWRWELEQVETNLEVVRRVANVKYKPRSQLSMDDYLAWYAVESGKVKLPPGALELINPKSVRVQPKASPADDQSHAKEFESWYARQAKESSPRESQPVVRIQPELSQESKPLPISRPRRRVATPGMFSLANFF